VFGDVDEIRAPVHADRGRDGVRLGVDDGYIVRSRVDHVDFVLLAVGRDAGRFAAYGDGLRERERAQIDHADRVALAVGDVSVFAVKRPVVGQRLLAKVPPGSSAEDGEQNRDKEEFSQDIAAECGRQRLPEREAGRLWQPLDGLTQNLTLDAIPFQPSCPGKAALANRGCSVLASVPLVY